MANNGEMSLSSFHHLRDFIYERSGLFFENNKKYLLEDRLRGRLSARGFGTLDEYVFFLRYDPAGADEVTLLLDSVTTGETFFYRDPGQMKALEGAILPDLLNRYGVSRGLRLLSAGCSTGEEPYTLAIMLRDVLGSAFSSWFVRIMGIDISRAAVQKAQEACYNDYAIHSVAPGVLNRYFPRQPIGYVLDPRIKSMVEFQVCNILDSVRMAGMKPLQLILCRNVLIYFSEEARRKVVADFYDMLEPGGYLMLGFSESLHNINRLFKVMHFPGAIFYKKE